MKARTSMALALVLASVLLAFPAPVLATPPEPLTIHANMWLTPDGGAVGGFSTEGLFVAGGLASEEFFLADGTIHGVKTLVGADGSSITIIFQARIRNLTDTTSEALGRFVILSGTGAYERLHGVGQTYATLDLGCFGPQCPPNIVAEYSGTAHFD